MGVIIVLPESGAEFEVKSLSRGQVRQVVEMSKDLFSGKISTEAYQDHVLATAYPALSVSDDWAGADVAHIVRVTTDYSIGGPASIKNFLRSGDGTTPV